MNVFPENPNYTIDSGTLNVVLGNSNCIVVASDSQRTITNDTGVTYSNDCKKLFLVGKQRALVIAGFAGINYPGLSEKIILQLPTLLANDIERCGEQIDFYDSRDWNDELPPTDLSPEFKESWHRPSPYMWWSCVTGSVCLIADILGSFDSTKATQLEVVGLHAGYKNNGEIKIERFSETPIERIGQWERKQHLMSKRQDSITSNSFLYATSGKDRISRLVLSNSNDDYVSENLSYFPAIKNYINHSKKGTLNQMQETEMTEIAKALIKLTASCTPGVGSEPIQIAVIKKNSQSYITDDSDFIKVPSIRAAGLSGCVYTSDYPFNQLSNCNFINCVIENNAIPVPIDHNFFYGSEFQNVKFDYSGGNIFFGSNNKLTNCQIELSRNCTEDSLNQIISHYGDEIKIIKPS